MTPPADAPDGTFLHDVLAGLSRPSKELSCKYFYDAEGSRLFERICELDEYYPTRCELAILHHHGEEIARALGEGCAVIEYGSGSGRKTRLLLDRLQGAVAYIPVDISPGPLLRSARSLTRRYPALEVCPVCADFTEEFELPSLSRPVQRRVVYFSGSTIGNFGPAEATALLRGIVGLCGPGGGLLIGVDLKKDARILHRAYNDALGVTAAFNLNLLARINRELDGTFHLDRFCHHAFYNQQAGRIEMHLISLAAQEVRIGGVRLSFAAGESIRTEYSYKYSLEEFAALASRAGLAGEQVWMDAERLYSVQYLRVGGTTA
jgi:dimethylhistidine N-methyltransferase